MRKEELDAILGGDSGPIERHLEALAHDPALPAIAIGVCTARIEEAEPALLAALEKASRGETLSEPDWRLFFRGLHVLGGSRRPRAFAPLMRMLRRPTDEIDALIGDVATETLPRIVAGVFDGDAASLLSAIEDIGIDEFVRGSLLGAATFLAWDGRIDRADMTAFLQRFFDRPCAEPGDHCWVAWVEAVALLDEHALVEKAREAFRTNRVEPMSMSVKHFEAMLAEAKAAPNDAGRFEKANLGYISDTLAELERWPLSDAGGSFRDIVDEQDWESDMFRTTPAVNPYRGVGRNDPCPCGSGKKFKKCCLT
jgi:hypothetical protein